MKELLIGGSVCSIVVGMLMVANAIAQPPIVQPTGLTITVDGKLIGTYTTLVFTSGNGVGWTYTANGSTLNLTASMGASALSKGAYQAGVCDFISSTNGTFSYTYSFGPTCQAVTSYVKGMHFRLVVDVTNASGGCWLALDTAGQKNIKQADGVTDPVPNFFVPAREYPIWFDGTVFRLE